MCHFNIISLRTIIGGGGGGVTMGSLDGCDFTTYILYIIIWVFLYRTLYLPVAVRIGPSRQARADTDCEGRYKVTHMIIILSLMYCDLYWQPQNIWNKVNLFIKYHIQGIVRVYQWVRNAILL